MNINWETVFAVLLVALPLLLGTLLNGISQRHAENNRIKRSTYEAFLIKSRYLFSELKTETNKDIDESGCPDSSEENDRKEFCEAYEKLKLWASEEVLVSSADFLQDIMDKNYTQHREKFMKIVETMRKDLKVNGFLQSQYKINEENHKFIK